MKKAFVIFFFLLFSPITYSCDVIDDTGTKIHLAKPATRIISLAPDITETLFAMGANKQIVGVINGSDYPPLAKKIRRVGAYNGIDLESIVALHPDLIVTWQYTFSRQLAALQRLGIPVYVTHSQEIADIPRTMRSLGCLTGKKIQADEVANKFLQRLLMLRKQYADRRPVNVFYQIGSYSLITINQQSWINQVIKLCGGKNLFAAAKTLAPEVSWEAVVTANPDVIVSDVAGVQWKVRWQAWSQVAAVKNNLLFSINPDWIDRAGPRLIKGAELMCQYLEKARDKNVIK